MATVIMEGHIPRMCPSVNEMYPVIHGHKILSKEGQAFKNEAHEFIVDMWKKANMPGIPEGAMLRLDLWFRFKKVFTKGEKAKSRFIHLDVTNRVKIMEDALQEALGFDDDQHFIVCERKMEGEPGIYFRLWVLDEPEEVPQWPGPT